MRAPVEADGHRLRRGEGCRLGEWVEVWETPRDADTAGTLEVSFALISNRLGVLGPSGPSGRNPAWGAHPQTSHELHELARTGGESEPGNDRVIEWG